MADTARILLDRIIDQGGATIDPVTWEHQVRDSGYWCAIGGSTEVRIPVDFLTYGVLSEISEVIADQYPHCYLGVWVHDGHLFIEPSEWLNTSLEQALEVGRARNQIALWDIANETEVQCNE